MAATLAVAILVFCASPVPPQIKGFTAEQAIAACDAQVTQDLKELTDYLYRPPWTGGCCGWSPEDDEFTAECCCLEPCCDVFRDDMVDAYPSTFECGLYDVPAPGLKECVDLLFGLLSVFLITVVLALPAMSTRRNAALMDRMPSLLQFFGFFPRGLHRLPDRLDLLD